MALDNTVLLNGNSYSHAQIVAIIGGVKVTEIGSLNYTEEQEKQNNFGTGNRPTSRSRGAINASASIEMSMVEVEAIRKSAPNGSLLLIDPFDIQVTFMNEGAIVTHIIEDCEFTNDGVESSQGADDIRRSFDLVAGRVNFNG